MSDEFLRTFFPHAQQALERYAPHFLELAFPQWVRTSCPEPLHLLRLPGGRSVVLRHISLLPLQLAGVAVGIAALRRTGGFWRWGFAAFGLMNAVSIFAHDFGAASGAWWRAWATLDVVFTCTANVCVMLAARAQADPRAYDGRGAAGTALALGVAAAAAAAGFGLPGVPFIHELLYIGTSGAAFFCCSWLLVLRPASGWAQRRWLLLACLGAVVMMGCLWADRALCSAFGSHINFVHLLFLGCDIVFFAFLQLYRAPGARLGADKKQP